MKRIVTKDFVFTLLQHVIDPELMISIIDLGLVYDVVVDDSEKTINIEMTLTSAGCPLGEVIVEDVLHILGGECEGYKVDVQLVWEPEWSPDRLTEAGKQALKGN